LGAQRQWLTFVGPSFTAFPDLIRARLSFRIEQKIGQTFRGSKKGATTRRSPSSAKENGQSKDVSLEEFDEVDYAVFFI